MPNILPRLHEVPPEQRAPLLTQKLRLCCIPLDFSSPQIQRQEKEIKRQELSDILFFIKWRPDIMGEGGMYNPLFTMIASNVARCLPPRRKKIAEEDRPTDVIDVVSIENDDCRRSGLI